VGSAERTFPRIWSRLALIGLGLVLAWGFMGYRLVQIQVFEAPELATAGLNQRLVSRDIAPQRGKIFDRNGDLLAMTVDSSSLFAVPSQVEEPLYIAQQVGGFLGVDIDTLYERLTSNRDFVYLKRQVDPELAQQVLDLGLRGVFSHPEPTRYYPAGVVASHITGFVDIDGVGREGVELVYEEQLRGTPGRAVFERAPDGTPILQGISDIVPATPGVDLMTTIDLPLQYQAQKACQEALVEYGADECWVVALHVETGEILALAGVPEFDPQTRQRLNPRCGQAEDPVSCRLFSNFAVRGIFEPGSTLKLVTVAAALEEGEVSIGTIIPDVPAVLELKEGACNVAVQDLYGCYRDFTPHETMDMSVAEIFAKSSNIGTIMVAEKLGQARQIDYLRAFGLGAKTGVDYTAEAVGILNFEAGCDICWASAAIGYSVAASPLQMAAAFAAIGNEGVWTTPHLVTSQIDLNGATEIAGFETRRVVSPGTARLMLELLARAVEHGTGTAAIVEGYRVGGKTGTANKLGADGRYTEETRASFVGMAPISDPKVVVAVVIDNPHYDFRTGGLSAAPVFARVMEQALHRLGVTPDAHAR
jgi:cell division protein FtsI (penicillin-binding protein 3)